jgi:hypothetical protein
MSKFDVTLDDGKKVNFDFSAESQESLQYSRAISAIFNGRKSTQFLRKLGLYHLAAEISSKLARISHSGK